MLGGSVICYNILGAYMTLHIQMGKVHIFDLAMRWILVDEGVSKGRKKVEKLCLISHFTENPYLYI